MSSSLAESIAHGLGGAKKTSAGWICRCPCHDDKSASLSLTPGRDGNGIILNCFAGCKWEDIKTEIEKLGLLNRAPSRTSTAQRGNSYNNSYNKYDGAKFYIYRDIVGNILCRKVKLPNKKMWFERYESGAYVSGLAGMTVPLYNLQAVIAADTVYLVEGEKDAETLIERGFCATTNHAGAKSWAKHLTEQLRGKIVVLIPDNDGAGRGRIAIISKALNGVVRELRVFIPDGVEEKGDITDWVNNGGDCSTIFARSTVVNSKPAAKAAPYIDYCELFEEALHGPRKCIFGEKLMYKNGNDLWNPAVNAVETLKARALIANEERIAAGLGKFSISHVPIYFSLYADSKEPEFLVDVPEWDEEDRISAMAYLVEMRATSGITDLAFSELLKEWCALAFQRLENPMIQNRILVLQGGQGIGKDTWISMLVDGLGQFSVPLSVMKEDKDTFLALHQGLVMKISEFDKTAKTEVSTLKDIITAANTNIRAPYDRDAKLRHCRASFVSSANIRDLLRDSTGNRRFLIFEIERIEYAYAGWDREKIKAWQMQCLAQMKYLASIKYTASADSWRQMREYIEEKTPEDYAKEITSQFITLIRKDVLSDNEIPANDSRANEAMLKIAKDNGIKFGTVKQLVKSELGMYKRVNDKRFWKLKLPLIESNQTPNFDDIL